MAQRCWCGRARGALEWPLLWVSPVPSLGSRQTLPPQPSGRCLGCRLALGLFPEHLPSPEVHRSHGSLDEPREGDQGGAGTRMHPTVFSRQTWQPTFPLGFQSHEGHVPGGWHGGQ